MYFKQLIYFHSIATFEMEPKIGAACVDINFRIFHSVIWLENANIIDEVSVPFRFCKDRRNLSR